ncbi:MAG: hypothetical protein IPH71_14125 [Proteobacteria bacterium]|nr:hypothetical protein [Pseudomonadota bacterium]
MAEAEYPSLHEWRQGSILPQSVAHALNLAPASDDEIHCTVVVSHDCDIANANHEPEIEVIAGQFIASANGNFTEARIPENSIWICNIRVVSAT